MTDWLAQFEDRGVHRTGHFQLSSGLHSDTYLQCALALTDPAFADELGAALAAEITVEIDVVVSPAIGGLLAGFVVARALGVPFVFTERKDGVMTLRRGQAIEPGARVLIVEDVLTTGGSAREAADVVEAAGGVVVAWAALVDRSTADQPLPFGATSLVRVTPSVWEPGECPLCTGDVPIDSPGSRRS
ncbi:MAG: orotate phosphoribosyltransferase [Nitriliruptorales bacterium]|nr:orotate phosphoribosyltransferase [Nitriliruptorales bacterium]